MPESYGCGGDDDMGRGGGSGEGRRRAKQLIRRRPDVGDIPPTRRERSPDFLRADRRRMPLPPCPFSIRPTSLEEKARGRHSFTKIIFARHACAAVRRRPRALYFTGRFHAVGNVLGIYIIPRNSSARLHLN